MKILILNWRDPKHTWAGGGEIYVFEQAARWMKMGHQVTVFCGEDHIEKNLHNYEMIKGIHVYRKGGRYTLYFWAIWYYLTRFRNKFDVVIDVENGIPFFTPLFCKKPKLCFVYHVHGKQFYYELNFPLNYIGYMIERYIFPLLYKSVPIIAISEITKDQLVKIGFDPKKISVVYCGVNESSRTKKSRIRKFSRPTLLYLGRIKKYKRVDLLVQILPKILKKIPQTRLIIAGWGTEASHLTNTVMRSKLHRKIHLVGPVTNSEKKLLLSKSWLFINPSIGEGWSISVIEANLHSTPAIAFNVPGLSESIQHEKTGLLVNSEEEMINTICDYLNNGKLQSRLSRNAYRWAHQFNWDRSAKMSIQILKKVINTY